MENASKALIMAGSVLIALIIIGALLLMFNNLTSYQEVNVQNTREAQIIEFNNQFETYNRKDVRGSDLYSLLNKVIDYNRRKSTEGIGKDEGQDLAYEPMTVTFSFKRKENVEKLKAPNSGELKLFKRNIFTNVSTWSITVSKNRNEFEKNINNNIKEVENLYNKDILNKLIVAYAKIYDENVDETKAEDNFKNITGISKEYNDIIAEKDKIDSYYEYISFKRAHFDCTSVEYSSIGRVTNMKFEFNGKFN